MAGQLASIKKSAVVKVFIMIDSALAESNVRCELKSDSMITANQRRYVEIIKVIFIFPLGIVRRIAEGNLTPLVFQRPIL